MSGKPLTVVCPGLIGKRVREMEWKDPGSREKRIPSSEAKHAKPDRRILFPEEVGWGGGGERGAGRKRNKIAMSSQHR